jgi:hypothetical protein
VNPEVILFSIGTKIESVISIEQLGGEGTNFEVYVRPMLNEDGTAHVVRERGKEYRTLAESKVRAPFQQRPEKYLEITAAWH